MRGAPRGQVAQGGVNVWPRVLPHRVSGVTTLSAPSVTSFGAETPDDAVPVTLVSAPAPLRNGDGEIALPLWPPEVITIAVLPEVDTLPAPAADNFRYHRINRGRAAKGAKKKEKRRPSREVTHSTSADVTGSIGTTGAGNREPKAGKAAKNEKSGKAKTARRQIRRPPNSSLPRRQKPAAQIRAATEVGTATKVGAVAEGAQRGLPRA